MNGIDTQEFVDRLDRDASVRMRAGYWDFYAVSQLDASESDWPYRAWVICNEIEKVLGGKPAPLTKADLVSCDDCDRDVTAIDACWTDEGGALHPACAVRREGGAAA